MEVPTVLCILLFTCFMALRFDDIILWNYHYVFLPLYIGLFNIFWGLSTTELLYYYLHADRYYQSITPHETFPQRSTATIVYTYLTPIWESLRAKCTTYILWATITAGFILIAESLNQPGVFFTWWTLVAGISGIVLMALCFLSWIPTDMNSDKCLVGFMLLMFLFFFAWATLFIWTKS